MTLYYHPMSPPARVLEALLKEIGVEFDTKVVEIAKGEQKTPEYLAINPMG